MRRRKSREIRLHLLRARQQERRSTQTGEEREVRFQQLRARQHDRTANETEEERN